MKKTLSDIPKLNKININKIEFQILLKKMFETWVKKIKKYIESGDVMQVVISHEITAYFDIEPIYFYRALRLTNPSPYMSFLIWEHIYYRFFARNTCET